MWLLIAATVIIVVGLNIKHEELSTDGAPAAGGDEKETDEEESAPAVV